MISTRGHMSSICTFSSGSATSAFLLDMLRFKDWLTFSKLLRWDISSLAESFIKRRWNSLRSGYDLFLRHLGASLLGCSISREESLFRSELSFEEERLSLTECDRLQQICLTRSGVPSMTPSS